VAGEVENETDGEFVDGLAEDHFPHCWREEWSVAGCWRAG
jgi:hypothetical protein